MTRTNLRQLSVDHEATTRFTALGWRALASARLLFATITLIATGIIGRAAQPAGGLTEPEVKAAAVYNLIEFTNWPSEAFASPDAPLVIAIVGNGPVVSFIDRLVSGESWHSRKIVVQHYAAARDIPACHVLFLTRSARDGWADIRAHFANRPVLAVSDSDNFAAQGGSVQLAIDRNRLKLFVNLAATRSCNLQLSSNLLRLATIVGPMPDPISSPHSGLPIAPKAGARFTLAMIK